MAPEKSQSFGNDITTSSDDFDGLGFRALSMLFLFPFETQFHPLFFYPVFGRLMIMIQLSRIACFGCMEVFNVGFMMTGLSNCRRLYILLYCYYDTGFVGFYFSFPIIP